MTLPPVVTESEWQAARDALLAKEKAHMRAGDALAAERRRLPAVEVTEDYVFRGPRGTASLLGLFEGRRQLIVYSFMLSPDHPEPCRGCSMVLDNLPHLAHLQARDTTFAVVARAPLEHSEPIRRRMGWDDVQWYSDEAGRFQADVGAYVDGRDTFRYTVFAREGDGHGGGGRDGGNGGNRGDGGDGRERIVKTWATAGRGVEALGSVWAMLDSTPLGRQETWEDSPAGWPQTAPYEWWRLHTEYAPA